MYAIRQQVVCIEIIGACSTFHLRKKNSILGFEKWKVKIMFNFVVCVELCLHTISSSIQERKCFEYFILASIKRIYIDKDHLEIELILRPHALS